MLLVATPQQYVRIEKRDVTLEHVRGPFQVWQDPDQHVKISTHDAVPINAEEAIVVYRRKTQHRQQTTQTTHTTQGWMAATRLTPRKRPTPA